MNKLNVPKFINTAKASLVKHSPEILTGLGIAGMITTTVLAVKATPKAMRLIENERQRQNEERRKEAIENGWQEIGLVDKLKPLDVIKVAWKPYIPAAITMTASTACLIGASSINGRRNAALATAYQLSATALAEYKEKVVETIGEKKEKTIREKVAQKKLDEHPIKTADVIMVGDNEVLFVEPHTMRPFSMSIEKLRKIINDLNYRMVTGMEEYISLSEFYDEIKLSRTDVSDNLGWNLGSDGQIEISWHPCVTDDGRPAFMLEYQVAPRRGFLDLM